MNIVYFLIVMMLLFQSTIYADTTASVRLSIRLFPIQHINVNQPETQKVALFNENTIDVSPSQKLSTYSTSRFTFKVDTVNSDVFNELSALSILAPIKKETFEEESYTKRMDVETDINNLLLVYSMETL